MSARHQLQLKLAPWALLTVSAAWGFSFIVMKDAIQRQSVNNFLFTRFTLAVIVMILIRPQTIKLFNKDLLQRGGLAGIFLGLGYIAQTLGLERTGAAITGFITGLYVVLTPLIASFVLQEKITKFTWLCIAVATFGLGLLSIRGFSVGIGEMFVLASAVLFAAHIIALSKWSSGRDVYAMTVIQLSMCAVLAGIASAIEGYSLPPDDGVWGVVIFTAVFATAIAFIVQTWSQVHMSATKVAVILTMEVVFAALFAIVIGGERLTVQTAFGGVLVVVAMYLIVLKEQK
jgi:drug/metabolite transporter (DMT)-like permease